MGPVSWSDAFRALVFAYREPDASQAEGWYEHRVYCSSESDATRLRAASATMTTRSDWRAAIRRAAMLFDGQEQPKGWFCYWVYPGGPVERLPV